MNSDRINIVVVISPNIDKKMLFIRSDFRYDSSRHDDSVTMICDEIKWAKSYDRSPTFGVVAIVDGVRCEYVFHNIAFAEVVYAED